MTPEETTTSQHIYQGTVIGLRVDTVVLPSGRMSKREIVEHRGSVAVVPIDDLGNVVLVRQYRKAVDKWLLEAPAGGLNDGEIPRNAAARELREETGYLATTLEHLCTFYTSPGFCTEMMHAFLATGLVAGEAKPEEDEEIETVHLSVEAVLKMIKRGELQDAKTIAAFHMAINQIEYQR